VFRVAAIYVVGAWIVLQVFDLAFVSWDIPATALRNIWIGAIVGFPIALILGWRYDIVGGHIVRTMNTDPDADLSISRADYFILTISLIVVAAITFGLVSEISNTRAPATTSRNFTDIESNSIAVLPFADMSQDKDQEYMSDGIAEEVLNLLAKIPGLRVISRSSAFSFKGKDINVPEVAEKLGVAHVLEGSVRKSGNDVRITVQLIDARNDNHLWSETYDRTLDDIFAIQDDIASHIVGELRVRLIDGLPKAATIDTEAYMLYLQARSIVVRGRISPEERSQAEELLQQVLAANPDYVPALHEMSRIYWQRVWGEGTLSFEEGDRLMSELHERILSIDPDNAASTAGYALRAIEVDGDLVAGVKLIQRALEADPSNENVLWIAPSIIYVIGRYDDAVVLAEYGVARNPLFSGLHNSLMMAYYLSGRYAESEAAGKKAGLLFPELGGSVYRVGQSQLMQGDFAGALATFNQADKELWRQMGAAKALHSLGRQAEFEKAYAYLEETWGDEKADDIAMVSAWTGDVDTAFAWLERWFQGSLVRNGEKWIPDIGSISFVLHDPMFRNLHDDPRWQPLLESKGVSHAQLAEIEFELPEKIRLNGENR